MPFDFLHFVVTLLLCSLVFGVMRFLAIGVLAPMLGQRRAGRLVHRVGGVAFVLLCLVSIAVHTGSLAMGPEAGQMVGWFRSAGALLYNSADAVVEQLRKVGNPAS